MVRVVGHSVVDVDGSVVVESVVWVVGDLFLFLRFPPTGDTLTSEGVAGSLVDVVVAILASVVGEAGAAAFSFLFLRFPPTGDTLTSEGATGPWWGKPVQQLSSFSSSASHPQVTP